jgi:hypothetical protein
MMFIISACCTCNQYADQRKHTYFIKKLILKFNLKINMKEDVIVIGIIPESSLKGGILFSDVE